jgi:RNA polymerase sigma-70 factor (ECF subfamily)
MDDDGEVERFVRQVEPELRRALTGHLAPGVVADAVAEAFAYAWQHRERVLSMTNPAGYLYRVAQSKSRARKEGWLPWTTDAQCPEYEPGLDAALAALPQQQFRAVWLVHACEWTYAETAEALGISTSAVGTHVARGMAQLRERLGEAVDG